MTDYEKSYKERLNITKAIIRNYRLLKAHCKCSGDKEFETLGKFGKLPWIFECYIIESGEKTNLVIKHVDGLLKIYKQMCENSAKPEKARRWRVIESKYISDDETYTAEIAEREHIDQRTVFKDTNRAMRELTALMFGIDGLDVK